MKKTTARKFYAMREVLPPEKANRTETAEGFLVGEPIDHNENGIARYKSYFSKDDEFFQGEDMTAGSFTALMNDSEALENAMSEAEEPDAGSQEELELALLRTYEQEAIEAYIAIHGPGYLEDFEEAYIGEYPSNEDFAQEMHAETGTGLPDEYNVWPYTCIDWEQASRELMYDHDEESGYYFRNI